MRNPVLSALLSVSDQHLISILTSTYYALCPDGVYIKLKDKVIFRKADPISDDEVTRLIKQMSQKIMDYAKKKGYLDEDGDLVVNLAFFIIS